MNLKNSFLDKLFVKQILFLLQFVPLSVKCYTPGPLYAHTATLVGKRLYFIGGSQEKEFFYLDLSESFDISNANWKNLTVNANLTRYNFATSVVHGGSIIFIGANGKIYIFVGSESDTFGKMIIFTLNLNLQDSIWSLGVNNNPPLARYGYTATLTKDGLILYIGGVFQDESYTNMNEIPIYDTLKDNWSNAKMNPTGKIIPEGRQMHSAVLSEFNTIIVYGGYYYEVSSKPELVILDISNSIYNWIPITGETLKPRWGHTSTYINSQMIVTFGIGFDKETNSILSILSNPTKISFEITNTYTYEQPIMPSFAPNPNMPASPTKLSPPLSPTASPSLLFPIIIIIIPIIIILIIIGFLIYYKKYKKQKAENENNNNNNANNNS
ncbi:galactose oxidase [Rhizophagus irregularis]|uniref:Galactose oxidase n=1 Tax=Rhizophagus irregularis TaxID=588596 RepID=A0A2I1H8D0_9GLOM|nr:galactose oxidase [Rhizophagus irregularis]